MTPNAEHTATATATATPHDLVVETLDRVNVTITAAGGNWVAGDNTQWTWPQSTTGFTGVPCGNGPQNQYSWNFTGPAESDPQAAIAKVMAAWEKQGWQVRTVAPAKPDDPTFPAEIAVDFPDGGGLGYTVSNQISGVDAQSACSSDPAMLTPSK